jgi:hypothetical protein
MSNVVLYTEKPSPFLSVGNSVSLKRIAEFVGLSAFPEWIHYWRETKHIFRNHPEKDIGGISAAPYTCDCGFGRNRGWDMHPRDMLAFASPERTLENSELFLGEVMMILCAHRFGTFGRIPSPFFFIVPNHEKVPHLLEVRRVNRFGYSINTCRKISADSKIPRQMPLFLAEDSV